MKLKATEKRDDDAKYLLKGFDYRSIDVVRTKLRSRVDGHKLSPDDREHLALILDGVLARCKEGKME